MNINVKKINLEVNSNSSYNMDETSYINEINHTHPRFLFTPI